MAEHSLKILCASQFASHNLLYTITSCIFNLLKGSMRILLECCSSSLRGFSCELSFYSSKCQLCLAE